MFMVIHVHSVWQNNQRVDGGQFWGTYLWCSAYVIHCNLLEICSTETIIFFFTCCRAYILTGLVSSMTNHKFTTKTKCIFKVSNTSYEIYKPSLDFVSLQASPLDRPTLLWVEFSRTLRENSVSIQCVCLAKPQNHSDSKSIFSIPQAVWTPCSGHSNLPNMTSNSLLLLEDPHPLSSG